jgi:photosystem II stability/assembly factor-like uncharacterized protein
MHEKILREGRQVSNRPIRLASQVLLCFVVLIVMGCDNSPGPPKFDRKEGTARKEEGEVFRSTLSRTETKDTSPKDLWVNKAYHDGLLGRITFLTVNPHDPSVVYAGARFGGLIRILNRADGWSNAGNVPIAAQYTVAVSPMDQSMGMDASEVTSLAIHPTLSSTFLVGMAGIFKSVDAGNRWKQVFNRPPVRTIVIDPKNPDNMFAASDTVGYYRSADGGETWTNVETDLRLVYCLLIDPTNTSKMYAGAYGSVYKSTDTGNTWAKILDAAAPSLAIDPTKPEVIIAATRKANENRGGVLKSEDGGKTWRNTTPNAEHSDFWACVIDPKDPSRMYAGESSGGGVLRTIDGGNTWTPINDGLEDLQVYSLAVDPNNPKIIWAGTDNGGVFRMVQSD